MSSGQRSRDGSLLIAGVRNQAFRRGPGHVADHPEGLETAATACNGSVTAETLHTTAPTADR